MRHTARQLHRLVHPTLPMALRGKPSPFLTDEPHIAQAFGLSGPETSTPMPKLYVSIYL